MNVRFFAGTKAEYIGLAKHNHLALYFCSDTRELFWGDRLLSDGMRVVATYDELPSFDIAADGVVYFVTETRNGYVLSNDRTEWIQTIYAPGNGNGQSADLSDYYTKTEADAAISDAIALIEIPAEYITETELEARGYLTAHQSLEGYATEQWVNKQGYLTAHQDLSGKADADHRHDDLYDTKGAAEAVKNDILNGAGEAYNTLKELSELIVDNKDAIEALETIATGKADKEHTHDQYLTAHQSLENYYTKAEVTELIPEAEIYKVDFNTPDYAKAVEAYNNGKVLVLINAAPDINSYAVMNYVSEKFITFTKFLTSRSEAYGSFNTYYLHSDNTWEVSKEVKLNKVEANVDVDDDANGELTNIRIGKEVYSIPSTDGLASTEYVDNAISNLEAPEVNLEGYATKTYVQEEIAKSDFITEEEVDAKGFLTAHQDLSEYAKKSDIPADEVFVVDFTAPDFTAALEAYKAGKLLLLANAAPDAAGYAVMNYVREDMITFTKFLMSRSCTYGSFNTYYLHNDNTWELAKEVKLNKVEANVDDEVNGELASIRIGKEVYSIPSTENLATKEYVKNAIAEAELNDKDVDISGLATKDELAQVEAKIPSMAGFASESYVDGKVAEIEIPTNVSAFANDAGYLTEHQSLDGYAKTEDIPDVSKFITSIPDEYITESELADELAKIEHPTVSLDGYATEAWVNEQGFIKEHQDLSHLAEKDHTHDNYAEKDHEHEQYLTEHQSLEAYAKREELFSRSYNDLTDKPEIPSVDGLLEQLNAKANDVVFTESKIVATAVGGFTVGEAVNGLTVAQLFAKLLGLSDSPGEDPDEPDVPVEPTGIIETILAKEYPLYQMSDSGNLVEIPYSYISLTEDSAKAKPTDPAFFCIESIDGTKVYGYQQLSADNIDIPYMIALPSIIDFGTNVTIQKYDDGILNAWTSENDIKPTMISNEEEINALFADLDISVPDIPDDYTLWVSTEYSNDESIYRLIITESEVD